MSAQTPFAALFGTYYNFLVFSIMFFAVRSGDEYALKDVVKKLTRESSNSVDFLETQDRDGMTLLMLSAELGLTRMIDTLLDCHLSCQSKTSSKKECIQKTLNYMNLTTKAQYSAITFASLKNHVNVVAMLSEASDYYRRKLKEQ